MKPTIEEILMDGTAVEAALESAARKALLLHKQTGHPIAVWRDGRVVWIPPEEIEIPPEPSVIPPRTDG